MLVFQVLKECPLYKALEKSGNNDVTAMIALQNCNIAPLTYDRSDTKKDTPFQEVAETSSTSSATIFFISNPLGIPFRMTGCQLSLRTLITSRLVVTALELFEAQFPCYRQQLLLHRVFNQCKPQMTLAIMASRGTHSYS